MNKTIILNNSVLEYRDTPWDEIIFEVVTKEILSLRYENINDVKILLQQLENECSAKSKVMIYFRTDINDIVLKKELIESGYYISETSVKLISKNVQQFNYNNIFKKNLDLKTSLNDDFQLQIKDIAYTSFNFSRFHEDPFVDVQKSKMRYRNWIDDLVKQNKKILIYQKNDIVYSFMFYEFINETTVSLILGGSKEKYGQLTPSFWVSVLNYLKNKGVKTIEVVVSAGNTTIINLYIINGFLFKNVSLDYHKIIKQGQ